MFKNILFVCEGNICRSPMGEYLFRRMAEKSGPGLKVSSAGIRALTGHGADGNAVEVMLEHGIDISGHCARQINEAMVKENELILVMESWQQKEIEQQYPFSKGRVRILGSWNNNTQIPDPYRLPKQVFVEVYTRIYDSCCSWCERL